MVEKRCMTTRFEFGIATGITPPTGDLHLVGNNNVDIIFMDTTGVRPISAGNRRDIENLIIS